MSLAFLNGHTRAGALSADVLSARLTQTDTIEAGTLGVGALTVNTLTVNVSATLGGTVTFAGPLVMNDDATFNDPATFNDTVTVAAGSTVTVGSDTTFNADVVIGPGHTLTVDGAIVSSTAGRFTIAGDSTFGGDLEASTISGNPSFTDGAVIPLGETLAMAGATLSGGPTLSGGATVTAGQTLTMTGATLAGAVTVSGGATFSGGATVSSGQTLAMSGATISGKPTLSGGATVTAGQTLTMTGATLAGAVTVSGGATFSGGATISSGQTLVMSGATISGGPTLSGGATVSSGQTLAMSGATISGTPNFNAGLTATTINTLRTEVLLANGRYQPELFSPGQVFPTMTLSTAGSGLFALTAAAFSGEASNGTDPASARGGSVQSVTARITAISGWANNAKGWIFNNTPYTFYIAAAAFPNINTTNTSPSGGGVWYPLTTMTLSRASTGSAQYLRQNEPLHFVSNWGSHSTALLSSPDCTFGSFRSRYSVTAINSESASVGANVRGALAIDFTTAAPTDPVRIQVPLPVGPQASGYGSVAGFRPRCGYFLDWVASEGNVFGGDTARPVWIGGGEIARANMTTYALEDATARVAVFVEPTDPNVGYIRVVVSGFTGGAGTYRLRAQYDLVLDNILYRATYPTF